MTIKDRNKKLCTFLKELLDIDASKLTLVDKTKIAEAILGGMSYETPRIALRYAQTMCLSPEFQERLESYILTGTPDHG